MDEDAGPPHLYPGSHDLSWAAADLSALGLTGWGSDVAVTYPAYERWVEERVRAAGLVRREFLARKGQALVWAASLLHGGSPILDRTRTRLSQVTHYFFAGCSYWTPLLSDVPRGLIRRRYPVDVRTGAFHAGSGAGG